VNYFIRFDDGALADLKSIYDYVALNADHDVADGFVGRIEAACDRLTMFPNRGTPRDDIFPGLRSISFEKRTTIFYSVNGDDVVIIHVLHGGRDIGRAFGLGVE
jgi:toxin ParE1/3/4